MKETHLSLDDRFTISQMLLEQQSFKQIALAVGKDCTSISREIRNHIQFRRAGGYGRPYNACLYRRVAILCSEGRIEGAQIVGNSWAVPANAEKPVDARIKSGRYIKSENKSDEVRYHG